MDFWWLSLVFCDGQRKTFTKNKSCDCYQRTVMKTDFWWKKPKISLREALPIAVTKCRWTAGNKTEVLCVTEHPESEQNRDPSSFPPRACSRPAASRPPPWPHRRGHTAAAPHSPHGATTPLPSLLSLLRAWLLRCVLGWWLAQPQGSHLVW